MTRLFWTVGLMGCLVLLGSCKGKQQSDEEWVDSVLEAIDSIPDDTLAYDTPDVPLSPAVDENFNDFIYTFTHNRSFETSRVAFPLSVSDAEGQQVRVLKSGNDFRKEFHLTSNDYYVLLMNSEKEMEKDLASQVKAASVHLVDFNNEQVRRFGYNRQDGQWRVVKEVETSFEAHPMSSFLDFYRRFATDSIYQVSHVAQPLNVTMPDDEDEHGMIEGTIDASQFPIFKPELPMGRIMVMDYGNLPVNSNRVVMVKCGMASSMMDILTFEREGNEWQLVELEE